MDFLASATKNYANFYPKKSLGFYDITPDLPERVLRYVLSFDKEDLLPVNTIDAILFSKKYTNYSIKKQ